MENVYNHHHAYGEEYEEDRSENVHENLWFRSQWYSGIQSFFIEKGRDC